MTTYPEVILIKPLVIRLDKLSLLVDGTCFRAVVKRSSVFTGFNVFVNSTNQVVYTQPYKSEYTNTKFNQLNYDDNFIKGKISDLASKWLDTLQENILTTYGGETDVSSENIIKSIDRLCWQLHYDITKSDSINSLPSGMTLDGYVDGDVSHSIDLNGNTIYDGSNNIDISIKSVAESLKSDTDSDTAVSALNTISISTKEPEIVDYLLLQSNWNNKEYTISDGRIKENSYIHMTLPDTATLAQYNTMSNANVTVSEQSNGYIKIVCNDEVPNIDIPILIIIK